MTQHKYMTLKFRILYVLIILIFTLLAVLLVQKEQANQIDPPAAVYVIPAITDEKVLPGSYLPPKLISNRLTIKASPGEYEPASFVVRFLTNIDSVEVAASDLSGPGEAIPSSNVDIRIVKCWYQAGTGQDVSGDVNGKFFTPELLLKNDSLVKVEGEENYVWNRAVGDYTWISQQAPVNINSISRRELSIHDADRLQPVDIPVNSNKQFWVTVKIPDGQAAGSYKGTIQIVTGDTTIATLQIELEVLPIRLTEPYYAASIYYWGQLEEDFSGISTKSKNETQLRAELRNMYEHGITNPQTGTQQNDAKLGQVLSWRQELGMTAQPLFITSYLFDYINPPQAAAELDALKAKVGRIIQLARQYGATDVYFYGIDEATDPDILKAERPTFQAIHEAGGKVYISGLGWENTVFTVVGDIVDLFVASTKPIIAESARWHSAGAQVVSYANPQGGVEKPETYRRNYGLLLWQSNYDGTMNFAYQWSDGTNPWNDFDAGGETRDHNFTYPTDNGVIDTIQWEGLREGIDDIRYLTTLLETIEAAKDYKDTSAAESWLHNLKSVDLESSDLDVLRHEIIGHIISLQKQPPVLDSTGGWELQ